MKRGEPPLSEVGSLLYGVPDSERYCPLCKAMRGFDAQGRPVHCACWRADHEKAAWWEHERHTLPVPGCRMCENATEYEHDLARSIAFQEAGEE